MNYAIMHTLAGDNDMRQAVSVLTAGGETWTYAIPAVTSTCMLPPSGAELTNDISDNWRTCRNRRMYKNVEKHPSRLQCRWSLLFLHLSELKWYSALNLCVLLTSASLHKLRTCLAGYQSKSCKTIKFTYKVYAGCVICQKKVAAKESK